MNIIEDLISHTLFPDWNSTWSCLQACPAHQSVLPPSCLRNKTNSRKDSRGYDKLNNSVVQIYVTYCYDMHTILKDLNDAYLLLDKYWAVSLLLLLLSKEKKLHHWHRAKFFMRLKINFYYN